MARTIQECHEVPIVFSDGEFETVRGMPVEIVSGDFRCHFLDLTKGACEFDESPCLGKDNIYLPKESIFGLSNISFERDLHRDLLLSPDVDDMLEMEVFYNRMSEDDKNSDLLQSFDFSEELERSVEYLSMSKIKEKPLVLNYVKMARLLDRYYRKDDGTRWSRRYEGSRYQKGVLDSIEKDQLVPSDMKKELSALSSRAIIVNHSLKITNISLGLVDVLLKRTETESLDYLEKAKRYAPFLALLHDLFEDEVKVLKESGQYVYRTKIVKILVDAGFEDEEISEILQISNILNFKRPEIQKLGGGEQHESYLEAINSNSIARIMKISDMLQNSFSKHSEGQEKKYTEHYGQFIKNFCDEMKLDGLHELIPQRFIYKIIEANPYLEAVFESVGLKVNIIKSVGDEVSLDEFEPRDE